METGRLGKEFEKMAKTQQNPKPKPKSDISPTKIPVPTKKVCQHGLVSGILNCLRETLVGATEQQAVKKMSGIRLRQKSSTVQT